MIPFVDLRAQVARISPEIQAAVSDVLQSAEFVLGSEVAAFEEEFAAYCGTRYGIAVNSGTSALHLALLAARLGPDDEVITVPFTFVATVAAIRYTGARPVFVDVDAESYTMNVEAFESAITARTKAVIPVHLYGQPADMDPILSIARRHGLTVIEDAAQAHGAEYKGRRVGGIGSFGCFSFYPGKNLGACGEGGIVVTNNAEHAASMRMLRDWGQQRKYHHVLPGYNYRMDAIQGAVLRVKLRHLDNWNAARRRNAEHYNALFSDGCIRTPQQMPYARHVYHIYAVRTHAREALQQMLQTHGIQTGIHYPVPVHLQPIHQDLNYTRGRFPVAEQAAAEVLSLPMYAELTSDAVEEVASVVNGAHVA